MKKNSFILTIILTLAFCFLLGCNKNVTISNKKNDSISNSEKTNTSVVNNYSVKFVDYNDNVLYETIKYHGLDVSYPYDNPSRKKDNQYSYRFDKWIETVDENNKTIIYKASYIQTRYYVITLDFNGGTPIELVSNTKEVEAINKDCFVFDIVAKDGYKFVGWSYNNELIFDSEGNIIKLIDLTENMVFKAEYEEKVSLNITYCITDPRTHTLNERYETKPKDIGNVSESMDCSWNTQVNLVAEPNEGYVFIGWYYNGLELSNSNHYNYMMWDKDISIEARFAYKEYTLSIYSNNPDLGQVMDKNSYPQQWNDSKTISSYYSENVVVAAYTKTNVRFLGWYDSNNELLSTNVVYQFLMKNCNYSIEAKWDKFNIAYNLDDGINDSNNPIEYCVDDKEITLFSPSKKGYDFIGWSFEGKLINQINSELRKDVELYAIYSVSKEMQGFDFNTENNVCIINKIKEKSVQKIVIPEYVDRISSGAFSECKKLIEIYNLSKVNIDLNVDGINSLIVHKSLEEPSILFSQNDYVFAKLNNKLYLVNYVGNGYDIVLPKISSLSESGSFDSYDIYKNAFENNKNVVKITIPECVERIDDKAFADCSFLSSIIIPKSVAYISNNSFDSCIRLVEIYNLTNINYDFTSVIKNHSSLDEKSIISIFNGFIFAYDEEKGYLTGYRGLDREIVLPDSFINNDGNRILAYEIYQNAFYNCKDLLSVTISSSVESVCYAAFNGCSSIEKMTIPFVGDSRHTSSDSSTKYPFGYIFGENSFDNSVLVTQYYQKYYQSGYSDISSNYYIPSSLKEVVVNDCSYLPGGSFCRCENIERIVIQSATAIGKNAFYNCINLQYISICDNVEKIESSAFSGCSKLKNIILPSKLTTISYRLFENCVSLEKIVLPYGITLIDSYAFGGCIGLLQITLHENINMIGFNAFSDCRIIETYNLSSESVSALVNHTSLYEQSVLFEDENGFVFAYTSDKLYLVKYKGKDENLVLPNNIIHDGIVISTYEIYNYSFRNNEFITSVFIPNSIKSIGAYAFISCTNVVSIEFEENSQLNSINDYAFQNCKSLQSIQIPNSVQTMGKGVLSGCISLNELSVPFIGSKRTSGAPLGYIFGTISYENSLKVHQSSNTSDPDYYIPISLRKVFVNDCTIISKSSFMNCTMITEIYLNDKIKTIGYDAFHNCSSIQTIIIPNGVVLIDNSTFHSCSLLEHLILPSSITTIKDYSFSNCKNLKELTFAGTKAEWNLITKSSNWKNNSSIETINCLDGTITV